MNPEVIVQEVIIDMDIQGKMLRGEPVSFINFGVECVKKAIEYEEEDKYNPDEFNI